MRTVAVGYLTILVFYLPSFFGNKLFFPS